MMKGSSPHPCRHGTLHLGQANNGKTQLGIPSPQKGKLLELLLVLHLRSHKPPLTINQHARQTTKPLLGHHPGPTRLCKFTFEEGNLMDDTLSIFPNRQQQHDILHISRLSRFRLQHWHIRASPKQTR
jgi:hypothetical protein